jgi:hypothetical protein
MNIPTTDKAAQRLTLDAMMKDYQARGNKVPRYRMVKQRHKWMSMTTRNRQRVLHYADLVVTENQT